MPYFVQFFGRELHECFYFCICKYAFDDKLQTHPLQGMIREEINVQNWKIIIIVNLVERKIEKEVETTDDMVTF